MLKITCASLWNGCKIQSWLYAHSAESFKNFGPEACLNHRRNFKGDGGPDPTFWSGADPRFIMTSRTFPHFSDQSYTPLCITAAHIHRCSAELSAELKADDEMQKAWIIYKKHAKKARTIQFKVSRHANYNVMRIMLPIHYGLRVTEARRTCIVHSVSGIWHGVRSVCLSLCPSDRACHPQLLYQNGWCDRHHAVNATWVYSFLAAEILELYICDQPQRRRQIHG